jgi:LmbE family N-acetylglucosaminyl deacetylase
MIEGREYAHIYLSPHLDDAVLSCGGRIRAQTASGEPVAVVTVFAGAPDPGASLSPYAKALHARWSQPLHAVQERQREDREALALLGAHAVHWRYRDCIYRRSPDGTYAYTSEGALWGPIHPSEAGLIQALTERIKGLPLMRAGVLYVPLAVGRHVDHRIVRRAAERCEGRLACYEDFPYAAEPDKLQAALAGRRWTAETVLLSEGELEAKIAAIALYRSQLSTFWSDRAGMAASVRAFARRAGSGASAERYWLPLSRARIAPHGDEGRDADQE